MSIWNHQGQEHDTTFIIGHALLKKAILLLKMAKVAAIFLPECRHGISQLCVLYFAEYTIHSSGAVH